MKKNKGFTLIEVLAVLVILSLLITFSVVSVNKIKKKQEVTNRINVIRSILTAARAYEADYPEKNTWNFTYCESLPAENCKNIFRVRVSNLIEKGYVSFDTKKYSDLLKINDGSDMTIIYDEKDGKREFYFAGTETGYNIKLNPKKNERYIISDCGFETNQDTTEKGKALCIRNTCNNEGKCNGWTSDVVPKNDNTGYGIKLADSLY